MVAQAPPLPLTYKDLEEITDTTNRYEILQGELIVTAKPVPVHVIVATRLNVLLAMNVSERALGTLFGNELDVRFSKHDIVAPDLCFVSNERRNIIRAKFIEGAPEFVVEILSPSTRRYDKGRKLALYSSGGVAEYWIVDPEAGSVQVWDFSGRQPTQTTFVDGLLKSVILPNVQVDVEALFDDLPQFPEADDE